MRSRFVRTIAITFVIGCVAVLLSYGSFALGFNFHAALKSEYTAGFRANWQFMPSLLETFWKYQSRTPAIANVAEHERILRSLKGQRIAVYRPWKGYEIPIFDALIELGLDVSVLEPRARLQDITSNYDVIIFPQGSYHIDQLPEGEGERLRAAVRSGVDYIGLCAGTIFAVDELGIAPVSHEQVRMVAVMWMKTLKNRYWAEAGGQAFQAHYANGGFFPPNGLGAFEPLILAENFGYTAIHGRFGLGHVVLFTFHPEGGGITLNNQTLYLSGRDLESGKLLLWVLKRLKES